MSRPSLTYTSRRDFLRLLGIGGALVLLPGVLTACSDRDGGGITGPGTGNTIIIDLSLGDVAVLQCAYALEQLEADFYSQVVANFSAANLSAAERTILADIRSHELMHRDFLKAVLGANANFTVTPTFGGMNLRDRSSVLATARAIEDLGVAAYNGASQYITDANTLLLIGKIVSVEARHASAIGDLIAPHSSDFAPQSFDDAFSPARVATSAQAYIVDQLTFADARAAAFVQGPNGNG